MRICESFHEDGTVEPRSIARKQDISHSKYIVEGEGDKWNEKVSGVLREGKLIEACVAATTLLTKSRRACMKENVNGI